MEILFNIWTFLAAKVVPFVTLLGILIFVHELGHFLVALACKVRVEVFSLGFGKKLFSYKRGDTTYCLSIIPLGGYVKMFGEQPGEQIPESEKSVSFTHKTVLQRIAIVLAGPMMNLFFAVFIFFVVANMGEEVKAPVAGDIPTQSVAAKVGLRSGDIFLSAGNSPVRSWEELQKQLNTYKDKSIELEFKHADGAVGKITTNVSVKPNPNILSTDEFIGEIDGLSTMARGASVGVLETSPLKVFGLRSGDTIKAINGVEIEFFRDLDAAFAKLDANAPIDLDIERITADLEGSENLKITANAVPVSSGSKLSLQNLGLESADLYLAKVVDKSPAEVGGLKRGDRLVAINGKALTEWEQVVETIKSSDGVTPIAIDILRAGTASKISITPKMSSTMTHQGAEEKRFTIGILPYVNVMPGKSMILKASSFGEALSRGWHRTWDVTAMTVMSFVRLFQAKVSPKNIGGVLSIGQAASESFRVGITHFLQMMAIISVNLFILNLLPIPVLDGGHLLFYTIEMFRGSPVSLKKMEFAQQVGLALLMSLMVFALFNDFTRLFSSM